MANKNTFHLGLCMAGAISAGAYTAGVMDYLIETLDKWEKAKENNRRLAESHPDYDKSIPMHDVQIDVMGGASAGGITSIIAAVAIQNSFLHISPAQRGNEQAKKNNLFYDAWVNLVADEMMPLMLNDSDIESGKVISLFNSDFIKQLADKLIKVTGHEEQRNYFASGMDVIVSLSSLVGIPYQIVFNADTNQGSAYKMKSYRDFGHFIIHPERTLDDEGKPIKFNGRIVVDFKDEKTLEILRACAMATGAFPVGLASRRVDRESKYIKDNTFLHELIGKGSPDFRDFKDVFSTLVVDGGLMNNEPFEVVHKILLKNTKETEEQNESYDTFKGTVIMIDPFPSEDDAKFEVEDQSLNKVIAKIYSAMRGQLLFKPEDIIKALSSDNASRFMIVPSRNKIEGYRAIACGSFGGFGGFFNKKFREFDFYLGRRNCQKFLRDVLTVHNHAQNSIFSYGYKEKEAIERFKFTNGFLQVPIIPDVSFNRKSKTNPVEENLEWPEISKNEILKYKKALNNRTWKIVSNLTELNFRDKALLWMGYKLLLGRKINKKVMDTILESMKEHKLIMDN